MPPKKIGDDDDTSCSEDEESTDESLASESEEEESDDDDESLSSRKKKSGFQLPPVIGRSSLDKDRYYYFETHQLHIAVPSIDDLSNDAVDYLGPDIIKAISKGTCSLVKEKKHSDKRNSISRKSSFVCQGH